MFPEAFLRGATPLRLASSRGRRASDGVFRCPTCEKGVGLQVSCVLRVRRNPRLRAGKLVAGSGLWVWVCAGCLARGIITRVD